MDGQQRQVVAPENEACWLTQSCSRVDCGGFCLRRFKLNYLYDAAFVPPTKRKHIGLRPDADGTDEPIFSRLKPDFEDRILEFVANGENLYIHSSQCGNGKTSIALRLLEAYFDRIWPSTELTCKAMFISVPKLLIELKANISKPSEYVARVLESVATCDLVVWDDIGEKTATEFEGTHLYSMIDQRLLAGKANVFTSNLDARGLVKAVGDRLASRVAYSGIDIELKGADKRGLR